MNYVAPINFENLIDDVQKLDLYNLLILQLNKDFQLANEPIDLPQNILPNDLNLQLTDSIYRLLQHKFAEYLNLLYIIDISEETIKKLDGSDLGMLASQVSFLILKREWQKVWFRKFY